MANKKKHPKMDSKLVATKQKQEIDYIAKRYKIPVKYVRKAVKKIGRSRRLVYAELRSQGWTINTKSKKK